MGTGWKWAVAVLWWWRRLRGAAEAVWVSGEWVVAAERVERRSRMSTTRKGRWCRWWRWRSRAMALAVIRDGLEERRREEGVDLEDWVGPERSTLRLLAGEESLVIRHVI